MNTFRTPRAQCWPTGSGKSRRKVSPQIARLSIAETIVAGGSSIYRTSESIRAVGMCEDLSAWRNKTQQIPGGSGANGMRYRGRCITGEEPDALRAKSILNPCRVQFSAALNSFVPCGTNPSDAAHGSCLCPDCYPASGGVICDGIRTRLRPEAGCVPTAKQGWVASGDSVTFNTEEMCRNIRSS